MYCPIYCVVSFGLKNESGLGPGFILWVGGESKGLARGRSEEKGWAAEPVGPGLYRNSEGIQGVHPWLSRAFSAAEAMKCPTELGQIGILPPTHSQYTKYFRNRKG